MLGVKINQFDNSDGKIETFNKIFSKTPLFAKDNVKYVEISDIVERENMFNASPFVRYLEFYDVDWNLVTTIEHDFGEQNFVSSDLFVKNGSYRFKYYAYDLNGHFLNSAFNMQELADKMGCNVSTVKQRMKKKITKETNTMYRWNVKRKEL
jgi:hypothetical protein